MNFWTVAKRVVVNIAVVVTALVTTTAVGEFFLDRTERLAADQIRDDAVPGMVEMASMVRLTLDSQVQLLVAIGNASKAVLHRYEAAITLEEDRRAFQKLATLREAYLTKRAELNALLQTERREEIDPFIVNQLEKPYVAYRVQMLEMLAWNQQLLRKVADEISFPAPSRSPA
jgi:hypothetical protein